RKNYSLNVQYELFEYYVYINQRPSRWEKELLAKRLSLTFKQVTQWFINARRRTIKNKFYKYSRF
ncbi:hypothetical protein BCR36DRAFT_336559, partial [Piromyces finnis]